MPYIEVWVEDEPCDELCDGTCDGSKEAVQLQARIDEAIAHLRAGQARAALEVLADDEPRLLKTPDGIAATYKAWKAGRLPGFTNFGQK